MFPQYQLVQIISRNPAILSDLENQLKKASGENEREEDTTNDLNFSLIFGCFYIYSAKKLGVRVSLQQDQVWIETDEDPGKYPEFIKKDQESILYPDASFFEEVIVFYTLLRETFPN